MNKYKKIISLFLILLISIIIYKYGVSMTNTQPPIAKIITEVSYHHGEELVDNYAWLRDVNWPKVKTAEILDYVNAENNYYKKYENKILEKELYDELKARIQEEDESYPIRGKEGKFYYFYRMLKGKDYPVIYRKSDGREELLLDCNILSVGKTSFSMGDTEVSEDNSMLAYAYDSDGSERYNIHVKDISSGKDLPDIITGTIGSIVWNNASDGFYYEALNENWHVDKIFFHRLGTKQSEDNLIFYESDPIFSLSISRSSSDEYLLLNSHSKTSNEIQYLSLNNKMDPLKTAIPRTKDHLYEVDHLKGVFYILTNDKGKNFRLVSIKDGENFSEINFKEIIAHNLDQYIVAINLYDKCLVVVKKVLGLNKIDFYNIENHKLAKSYNFDEEIYEANVAYTNNDDPYVRIIYSSLTKPKSVLEYDFSTENTYVRKVDKIPSGYESNLYEAKRLWVESKDGVEVPISMVCRKDKVKSDEPNSLLLYGYGSYGYGIPVSFRPNIISLLDRGFIYVIAHIRGGDELGFEWYESAKFLTKKRTFEDFIATAEYLIEQNYTNKDKLHIMGGSAGGMLMGVVVNERPELFKSVVVLVPFVDVLNTMLDASLPLTPGEFEEWGNPIASKEYYDYIKSYSPYDNVKKQNYPDMLVTAGITDPRVGYWEAAKWVANLRLNKQGDNLLLLKTEMDSGHKGQSGRFKGLEEVAFIYSFLLR